MEKKSPDILQQSRSMQIRRKGSDLEGNSQASGIPKQEPLINSAQPRVQSNQQTQIKASRDVRFSNVKLRFLPPQF